MTNISDKKWLTNNFRVNGLLTRQPSLNPSILNKMNQAFKVPNVDNIPVKKACLNSLKSPRRRVQIGRVKNDLKLNQQSKKSFLPRPSFINSRRTMHCSRTNQLNSRKEVIKKMVFLAEYALKENKEIKESTPVKLLAGLTPRRTPRSKGYLVLPEFKKMGLKRDMGTPVQDLVRRRSTIHFNNSTPLHDSKNETIFDISDKNKSCISVQTNEEFSIDLPNNCEVFNEILRHCRIYNTEVGFIFGKLKVLDDCFENNIKELPDHQVYEEFCLYQSKKEEIYDDLKLLEHNFKNSLRNLTNVGSMLRDYNKKRKDLFEKRRKLHKDFEEVIQYALKKCETNEEFKKIEKGENKEEKIKKNEKVETPKLRRSLRLSKKNTFEELTPMSKKLKKLNIKSKGIKRVKSP